jgi:SlyX protein
MESRIQELEIRVAFQDDLLTGLNQQVHAAHQQIALLRAELMSLRDRVEGMKDSGASGDPAQEPPPPHY